MLQGLLEQGVPSKEIEVSNYLSFEVIFSGIETVRMGGLHCLKYHSSLICSSEGMNSFTKDLSPFLPLATER